MPRHSKQIGDRGFYSNWENNRSESARIGTESQLPFGYCCLTLSPVVNGTISPSGRIYSKEAILEYLLAKTKEIKELEREHEIEKIKEKSDALAKEDANTEMFIQKFSDTQGIESIVKRKASDVLSESEYLQARKKYIDNTDKDSKMAQLQQVCPWVPQFTPTAAPSKSKPIPKRPPSPLSGEPLRAKDLIPIDLISENNNEKASSGPIRYICPISRKTITNQKVIFIKTTGAYMLDETAQQLAYPTMTCPSTGKKFEMKNVIELVPAASGFSSTGIVEVKKFGLQVKLKK